MQSEIQKALNCLEEGKTILYPTDTIWGIGCDATNESAVDKIFQIKQRPKEKSLIILVDSVEMLKKYVSLSNETASLITSFELPTTVIYSNPEGLARNAVNNDNTIAIRIVNHKFCQKLIQLFGKPIISTSANISGDKNPVSFEDISEKIKSEVDFIVDNKYDTSVYKFPSKLIRINADNSLEYLR
ncbi:MAG: L-threonylcarbamoyladenylate synthase [Chitinophagales bacterium]